MRLDTLPSPGQVNVSQQLRLKACQAISQCEMLARNTAGAKTAQAAKLSAFFTACVAALAAYVEVVLPTVTTRVRTATNTATITFTEALQPSTTVPLTSVVFSPARTVTAIVVTGSTMVVTATGVIATDTITYTPPTNGSVHLGAKDLAGNFVATFTGVLA
jgi:hypothetical protein